MNFLVNLLKLFKKKEKNPTIALGKAIDKAKKYTTEKIEKKD